MKADRKTTSRHRKPLPGIYLAIAALLIAPLPLRAAPPRGNRITKKLFNYYSKRKNYRIVHRDVMKWFGTTKNGCVAYISTALRNIGVAIPINTLRKGYKVSTVTFSFSDYLEKDLGWRRMTSINRLKPGDITFTTGWPDHVFMFHSWKNKRRKIALVVDNIGFLYKRPMVRRNGSKFSPFGYALRPPTRRKPSTR